MLPVTLAAPPAPRPTAGDSTPAAAVTRRRDGGVPPSRSSGIHTGGGAAAAQPAAAPTLTPPRRPPHPASSASFPRRDRPATTGEPPRPPCPAAVSPHHAIYQPRDVGRGRAATRGRHDGGHGRRARAPATKRQRAQHRRQHRHVRDEGNAQAGHRMSDVGIRNPDWKVARWRGEINYSRGKARHPFVCTAQERNTRTQCLKTTSFANTC